MVFHRKAIQLDTQSIIAELEGQREAVKAIAALKSNGRQTMNLIGKASRGRHFGSRPEENFRGTKSALGQGEEKCVKQLVGGCWRLFEIGGAANTAAPPIFLG